MRIIHDMGEGAHKLGRIFLAAVTTVVVGYVVVKIPDITAEKLMMIVSVPMAYIGIKGKGYQGGHKPGNAKDSKPDPNPVVEEDFSD